jgi:hypothetical protein
VIYAARPADGADPDAARALSPEVIEARWFPAAELPELQPEASGALIALARARGANLRVKPWSGRH